MVGDFGIYLGPFRYEIDSSQYIPVNTLTFSHISLDHISFASFGNIFVAFC